jgi:hypothetical protein
MVGHAAANKLSEESMTASKTKILLDGPAKALEDWVNKGCPMPNTGFEYKASGKPILYKMLNLDQPWERCDIQREPTRKGLEKFAADCHATLSQTEQAS